VKFSRKIAKAADAMIMEFKKNSASGRSSIYREGLNLLLGIDRQDLPINSWKIAVLTGRSPIYRKNYRFKMKMINFAHL